MHTVALTATGRPVGILALRGLPATSTAQALLGTFANHAALALERAQPREQALRSDLLEEVDRLQHALMGAVSHDLRTPLATMKVASSMLLDPPTPLSAADTRELYDLIDLETDRLTRLVTSLLDMTRIDAGELKVRRSPITVLDLLRESVTALRSALGQHHVHVVVPDGLPDVEVDHLLIGQVLANLPDNANRHSPPGSMITVSGACRDDRVAISITDQGRGVPVVERNAVFDRFVRFDTGGRAGLGLTIAKTFIEAHDEHIWVEDAPGGVPGSSSRSRSRPATPSTGNGDGQGARDRRRSLAPPGTPHQPPQRGSRGRGCRQRRARDLTGGAHVPGRHRAGPRAS
jgi:two-component system sensor histidine kinase KdpD